MQNNMTNQTDWADELAILEAMAREMEAYIAGNEVYRTLMVNTGAGNRQFKMSGGDVLARADALRAAQAELNSADNERLAAAISQVEQSIYALRSRFHELLRRELKSRQGALQWAMESRNKEAGDVASPADIRNQQRIAIIRKELGTGSTAKGADKVDEMDELEAQLQKALNELEDANR